MPGRRILVIDDSSLIREVARLGLERVESWSVITAENGSDGVAKAEAERPDAILLDWVMPGMEGPAVCQALKAGEATRAIPVIFLTGSEDAAQSGALESLPVHGVIAKPFDPAGLAGQVAEALGWEI
jgi:CheY-like chemotaxis protein